jgi:hypothetical protein
LEIGDVGVLLLGVALGWFLLFAVRRYRVQWGAFALFMSAILGTTLIKFLYANELLPYYAIGLFLGFFGNMVVRATGTIVGGRVGQGLLEISAFSPPREADRSDDVGRGQEGEGEV